MRAIAFTCFLLSLLPAIAQNKLNHPATLVDWADRLDIQSRMLPQEITFVHMDNSCYYVGDTIFYKTYVLRGDNGRPTDLSRVLYTELLDNDGYLVERQILKLENGQAWGTFCLSDTLYSGFYELRAYTRWQLNWGVSEHDHSERTRYWFFNREMQEEYFREYDKIYSRVFPVYDKPEAPGEYLQDMTMRPLRRYYRSESVEPKVRVTIYPEGGEWIGGVNQFLAFEARFQDGKHADGTLVIRRANGQEVTRGSTEHRGRGTLRLKADATEKLYAEFEWGEDMRTEVSLPDIRQSGVALHTEQSGDSLHLYVSIRNMHTGDSLAMTILSNGMLQYHEVITRPHIAIPLSILPNGIAQTTIYDAQGRVWADRMTFVRHIGLSPQTVIFHGVKEEYEPYGKVELEIESRMGTGILSLAVRDKDLSEMTNDDGTLLTELLLSSQIKGFVEQPGYYFEATDENRLRHLDLLLMVQGWRRYSWHEMTHTFQQTQPLERTRIISGVVKRLDMQPKQRFDPLGVDAPHWEGTREKMASSGVYASNRASGPITLRQATHFFPFSPYEPLQGKQDYEEGDKSDGYMQDDQSQLKKHSSLRREVLVHAEFIQGGADMAVGETITEDGKFAIPIPDFHKYCLMHIAASDSSKWKKEHLWIVQDTERNTHNLPEFYVRLYFPYPRFVKPYDFYQTTLPALNYGINEKGRYKEDSTVYMRQVTARIRRGGLRSFSYGKPVLKLDAYDAFNSVVDAGMHPPVYYRDNILMLAIAANYIGEMGNKNRSYIMEPRWNGYNDSHFMDALTLFRFRNLCYLDSIYVYTDYSPRKEGDKRYMQSNQPEVSVDLHLIPDGGRRVAYRDRFLYLQGFNVCEDFYNPRYDKRSLPDLPTDYRRTIYWNPNLQLDDEGRATITFWNNSRNNQLYITAEGVTSEGGILTGKTP